MRRDVFDESDNVMSLVEMLGLAAALLTTLCWIPQALKTIRTRDTRSISLMTQGAFTLGIVLWLAYGLLQGDLPLILANAVSLVLVGTILIIREAQIRMSLSQATERHRR